MHSYGVSILTFVFLYKWKRDVFSFFVFFKYLFYYLIRIIINPKCDTSVLVLFKLYFFILH